MYISAPFTVDATPPDEDYTVHTPCWYVTICEDNQAGTTDYLVKDRNGNGPETKPAGSKHTWYGPGRRFEIGDKAGSISTSTGSANFVAEEVGLRPENR